MDNAEKIKILSDDFMELAHKMQGSYKPAEIALLANIGSALMAMMKLQEHKDVEMVDAGDDISDELMDAETYYERWQKTNDVSFRKLAKDELQHADFFIKHARMLATDEESKAKLQKYVDWYNLLSKRLG